MDGLGPRMLRETGTLLHRQLWLKLSPRSSSHETSRPSCYGSLWPTLFMVAIGQGMLPLQLRPPTTTLRPLIHRSSPRQESLLRPTIGFVQLSPSLGSYPARRCRRLSWPRNSCVGMPVHGGPTIQPLAPWTTKCRGLSSATPSAPTTSQ
jgi:hypothetical protein